MRILLCQSFGPTPVKKETRVEEIGDVTTTVAGTGTRSYSGDGGLATSAEMNSPENVAIDVSGNIYIADTGNHRIRKVTKSTGIITTVAGHGYGFNEAYAPRGVAVDTVGNIYYADAAVSSVYTGSRVIKVTKSTGTITTVAGGGEEPYFMFKKNPSKATSVRLFGVSDVVVDASGDIYFSAYSQYGEERIYKVTQSSGIISVYAGGFVIINNKPTYFSGDGGPATSATFGQRVQGIALDTEGNLYVADTNNCRIRKVTKSTGIITTVVGKGTSCDSRNDLHEVRSVAVDTSGNIYFASMFDYYPRMVTKSTGIITTLVVSTEGTITRLTVDSIGTLYITSSDINKIYSINVTAAPIATNYPTLAPTATSSILSQPSSPPEATVTPTPTALPSSLPSSAPSASPTSAPIFRMPVRSKPSRRPVTAKPSTPTSNPTAKPSRRPVRAKPSRRPVTAKPSTPTSNPTAKPSRRPVRAKPSRRPVTA